ncbi:uncharacterized protein AMSG_05185 [Thecamonas trahens ATCC 50062]|uniref:Uncharacterized protein n=1 Tax=Thecamonas trahens ATCC 50062 TaxID=461836 RepID=A0A0L0DD00_THETB|nr:hypothetical protein AMSG_05185 [Thecamonas trahens ATCC 50062]KNC49203.1 hypothetical protein AMSG_05185 [Thecamonas trahens ATCC 50062]|eukprot:XP_013757926.1 hypothetical protein AMSG_05185 [Thecamonas trahens ATCC 50062]
MAAKERCAGGCCTPADFAARLEGTEVDIGLLYSASHGLIVNTTEHVLYAMENGPRYSNFYFDVKHGTCTAEHNVATSRSFVSLCFDASNPDWRIADKHPQPQGSLVWEYVPQSSLWHVLASPPCAPVTVTGSLASLKLPGQLQVADMHVVAYDPAAFALPTECGGK